MCLSGSPGLGGSRAEGGLAAGGSRAVGQQRQTPAGQGQPSAVHSTPAPCADPWPRTQEHWLRRRVASGPPHFPPQWGCCPRSRRRPLFWPPSKASPQPRPGPPALLPPPLPLPGRASLASRGELSNPPCRHGHVTDTTTGPSRSPAPGALDPRAPAQPLCPFRV